MRPAKLNSLTEQLLLFLLIIKVVECKAVTNDRPVVQTKLGAIRGVRADDGNYTMFLGIPYAGVNKSNVFGDSIPYPPFQEVFEADDDSALCPQFEDFNRTFAGSLDCLQLNVYVPDSASEQNPLPVMVYIYGGSFVVGFAGRFLYGPEFLIRHDVILVTFNYRLGPYGFMCLNTPEVPGNAGLKDQVKALRWVKQNIGSFGGDADRVTVFGNSAGGVSIAFHLMSQKEKLFSNAIMQSASAFSAVLVQQGDLSSILRLSEAVGFQTNDVNAAIQHLSDIDPHRLINASMNGFSWLPCIEQEFSGIERFLFQPAINSDFSKAKGVSIMLGYNSNEGMILSPMFEMTKKNFSSTWNDTFKTIVEDHFNFNESQLTKVTNILQRFYIGDMEVKYDVKDEIANLLGDDLIVYPVIRSIKHFLEAGATNVYQYLFSYNGQRNSKKYRDGITEPGAVHSDELGYLFKVEFIPQDPVSDDQLIIDRMTVMWTNFAKYGDPTPQITTLLPVKWEPITKESPYHFMNINTTMTTGARYEYRRMSFWDLLFEAYKEFERGFISPKDDKTIQKWRI